MKAKLGLKRFTVNETEPELHFTKEIKSWKSNKFDKCFEPPTRHQNVFKMFQTKSYLFLELDETIKKLKSMIVKLLDDFSLLRPTITFDCCFHIFLWVWARINYGLAMVVQSTCCLMFFRFSEINNKKTKRRNKIKYFKRSNS